ncbi:MAG: HAD hydrolase-like protein, partial [Cytophagaceae bacterium]
ERAASKYKIDMDNSWMIGDRERDLIPARKLGLKTVLLEDDVNGGMSSFADYIKDDLLHACEFIVGLETESLKS